jgi:hypothetical protein
MRGRQSGGLRSALYFNEVLIDENLVLRWEPIPLTTAMIARVGGISAAPTSR